MDVVDWLVLWKTEWLWSEDGLELQSSVSEFECLDVGVLGQSLLDLWDSIVLNEEPGSVVVNLTDDNLICSSLNQGLGRNCILILLDNGLIGHNNLKGDNFLPVGVISCQILTEDNQPPSFLISQLSTLFNILNNFVSNQLRLIIDQIQPVISQNNSQIILNLYHWLRSDDFLIFPIVLECSLKSDLVVAVVANNVIWGSWPEEILVGDNWHLDYLVGGWWQGDNVVGLVSDCDVGWVLYYGNIVWSVDLLLDALYLYWKLDVLFQGFVITQNLYWQLSSIALAVCVAALGRYCPVTLWREGKSIA